MKVAVGCDHRGFEIKPEVLKAITDAGHSYEDMGCYSTTPVDYPDVALNVARAVAAGKFERGILICGTGIGMCITANKVKGIRAALCYNSFSACRARQHNDANIMCLGAAKEQRQDPVAEIVKSFLTCEFEGGRHQTRVDKIREVEG